MGLFSMNYCIIAGCREGSDMWNKVTMKVTAGDMDPFDIDVYLCPEHKKAVFGGVTEGLSISVGGRPVGTAEPLDSQGQSE